MRIAFLGPPGAGKGTQVDLVSREYGVSVLSTGDAFRAMMKREDKLAERVRSYVEKGELVPDEVVFEIVKEFVDNKDSFILDGYPRNLRQAELLDDFLEGKGLALTGVVNILLDEDEIVKRLTGRLVCPQCGRVYNIYYSPPREDKLCDDCGVPLERRIDDEDDVIRQRIKVYHREMKPVVDFYQRKALLFNVDGTGDIHEVFERIKKVLDGK